MIEMGTHLRDFGETAKGLARNPLGIIALFIALVYGFAALVTAFASSLRAEERLPLVWFLVLFPVLVLVVFAWLVSRHSARLYAPSDYKNEENFIRMQIEQLEAKVKRVDVTSPRPLVSGDAVNSLTTPHSDSRLAIAQMRLDVERELFLLSRHALHRGDVAAWHVSRYLEELEKERVLDPALTDNLRNFVSLSNTIVHGTAVPEDHVQRSAAVGSSLVATLRHKRLVAEAEQDFEGHGLWHMHRHLAEGQKKHYFWSAVAASLPQFEYDYDIYREAAENYNEKLASLGHGSREIYVLSLEEFVTVLEFRESELLRIIRLWQSGQGWGKGDRAIEWRWPSEWGDPGWTGPILHEKVHLWGAEEDLVRTRAALADYRPRMLAQRRIESA
jgi:hypothetical protein